MDGKGGIPLRARIKLFFFFLILITALVALGLGALLLGIFPLARPYTVEGPVVALSLPVSGEGGLRAAMEGKQGEQRAEDALRPLVRQAADAGVNTLLVELTDPESGRALFADEALDPLLEGADLLELICRLAKEAGIQTFVLADPAALDTQLGAKAEEDPLAERCTRLLRRYPIAGLVLSAGGGENDPISLGQRIGRPRGGRTLGLLVDAEDSPQLAAGAEEFSMLLVRTDDPGLLFDWRAACPDAAVLPAPAEGALGVETGMLRRLCYAGALAGARLGDLAAAADDPGRLG